jgi:DNA gyrase subunit B
LREEEGRQEYGAEQIKVLEGLEAVRAPWNVHRHHGYQGLHHCLYEVVDNSVDEALNATVTR